MAGYFELRRNAAGQYSFVLKAGNHEVILRSEQYESRGAAEGGIASVQKNAADAARYRREQASDGRHYFNLCAANHQVIGSSQMYASEAGRDQGVASVQANGGSADIRDLSGEA